MTYTPALQVWLIGVGFETDTDNVVPLTLLEYTIHQLVVFGTIIVVYPFGQAVTVAVFVPFAPLLIEPKLRLTYWTCTRFVILVKKEQQLTEEHKIKE